MAEWRQLRQTPAGGTLDIRLPGGLAALLRLVKTRSWLAFPALAYGEVVCMWAVSSADDFGFLRCRGLSPPPTLTPRLPREARILVLSANTIFLNFPRPPAEEAPLLKKDKSSGQRHERAAEMDMSKHAAKFFTQRSVHGDRPQAWKT